MAEKHIGIYGNIAAGKTTATKKLFELEPCRRVLLPTAKEQELSTIIEDVVGSYLPEFYKDMPRWAFHSQMWFLAQNLETLDEIRNRKGIVVTDRVIQETIYIFTKNLHKTKGPDGKRLMSTKDYNTFMRHYDAHVNTLKHYEPQKIDPIAPDLLVYLRIPQDKISVMEERIRIRDRKSETETDKDLGPYLASLNKLYDKSYGHHKGQKITIDASQKMSDEYFIKIAEEIALTL